MRAVRQRRFPEGSLRCRRGEQAAGPAGAVIDASPGTRLRSSEGFLCVLSLPRSRTLRLLVHLIWLSSMVKLFPPPAPCPEQSDWCFGQSTFLLLSPSKQGSYFHATVSQPLFYKGLLRSKAPALLSQQILSTCKSMKH